MSSDAAYPNPQSRQQMQDTGEDSGRRDLPSRYRHHKPRPIKLPHIQPDESHAKGILARAYSSSRPCYTRRYCAVLWRCPSPLRVGQLVRKSSHSRRTKSQSNMGIEQATRTSAGYKQPFTLRTVHSPRPALGRRRRRRRRRRRIQHARLVKGTCRHTC